MAKTFDELIAVANKIRTNELPESNTHTLVGEQLLQMVNKMLHMKSSIQGNTSVSVEMLQEDLNTEKDKIKKLIRDCLDAKDILLFGGIAYIRDLGTRENQIVGSGEGVVYYDDAEFLFFKLIGNICYLNWDGIFPNTIYSPDHVSFRSDKIYLNTSNFLLYTGSTDGTCFVINELQQGPGISQTKPMSQNAVTEALKLLADRVVDAKDIVPFDGSSNNSINVILGSCYGKEGDIIWSGKECMFLKKPDGEQSYYTEWDGDFPSTLYNGADGYPKQNQIFQCNNISYVANGPDIQVLNVVPIYQTTGASTSGTMSQGAITKLYIELNQSIENVCGDAMANSDEILRLKESLVGKIIIDLGIITDLDQQLSITEAGIYRYITLGPHIQGKPQPQYQNTLIVADNKQYLFSKNGILTRTLTGSIWSSWRNILDEITMLQESVGDTSLLQTEAKDNLVNAVNETTVKIDNLEAKSVKPMWGVDLGMNIQTFNNYHFSRDSTIVICYKTNPNGSNYQHLASINGNNKNSFTLRASLVKEIALVYYSEPVQLANNQNINNNINVAILAIDTNRIASIYINGVVNSNNVDISTLDENALVKLGIGNPIYYSIRTFNYCFTQADVDAIYNQGRCFDMQLSDDLRDDIVRTPVDGITQKYWGMTNINSNGDVSDKVVGISAICFLTLDLAKDYEMMVQITGLAEGNRIEFGTGDINESEKSIKNDGIYIISLKIGGSGGFKLYGTAQSGLNIKLIKKQLLDEFTPDSLTTTRWVNTGTNATDLILTNPAFSYENPIPERQWCAQGTTYPTPVAMGQKLYILNTDGTCTIKEAGIKPNTRQFNNSSDWQ